MRPHGPVSGPLDDIRLVAHDLLGLTDHCSNLAEIEPPDRETFDLMLEQGGRFCEQVLGGYGYIREQGMEQLMVWWQ